MKNSVIVACLLCLGLLVSACGKKGDPMPQDQKNLFAWKSADAYFTQSGCLAVTASMTGATRNVDGFTIELEPLAPPSDPNLPPELASVPDTCEGCPFTPRETKEVTPGEAIPGDESTRYVFNYCPALKADAYRWRLVARNVFLSFPYALTPIKTVRK